MKNKPRFLCLALSFFLMTPWVFAAEHILIHLHLFQAVWTEDQPGLKQIEVLTTSSRPELASLKEKAASSERELTVAAIDTLLDLYGLQTVDDLFLHERWWDGKDLYDKQWDGRVRPDEVGKKIYRPMQYAMVFGNQIDYRIDLFPKKTSSDQISLHVMIKTIDKNSKNLLNAGETIIDQQLSIEIGNPIIVTVPHKDRTYFMMVLLSIGNPQLNRSEAEKENKIILISVPPILYKIKPAYPNELRRRQIGGEIGLQISINEKGDVLGVEVKRPIHPYLNYTAVQAFRQWKFEPYFLEGKPVPASFPYTYGFYPSVPRQEKSEEEVSPLASDAPHLEKLRIALSGAGEYCQRLEKATMDFLCEETIKETHYNLLNNIHWGILSRVPRKNRSPQTEIEKERAEIEAAFKNYQEILVQNEPMIPKIVARWQFMDPQRTLRNNFLCDYQIIRKAGSLEERRFILKENNRRTKTDKNLLEEKRFSGISSLFAPLRVLAKACQPKFHFKLLDEERIRGKNAYVIEAMPKSEDEDGIWRTVIWIDMKNFQVLKCEIEGIPIDGYEDVLNDCAILNIKPNFVSTHEYDNEKKGILFPSRTKVRVAYPGIDFRGPIDKIVMNLAYDKYKFFIVETKPEIIK